MPYTDTDAYDVTNNSRYFEELRHNLRMIPGVNEDDVARYMTLAKTRAGGDGGTPAWHLERIIGNLLSERPA